MKNEGASEGSKPSPATTSPKTTITTLRMVAAIHRAVKAGVRAVVEDVVVGAVICILISLRHALAALVCVFQPVLEDNNRAFFAQREDEVRIEGAGLVAPTTRQSHP